MKKILALMLLPVLAGCLTAGSPQVSYWPLDYVGAGHGERKARFGVARLLQTQVRSPYNNDGIVVLRADGTVAFDPCNLFAANPPALMKWVGLEALRQSGVFSGVVEASSAASADVSVELVVNKLALDCRKEGERRAVAAVLVRVLDGKLIRATVTGAGSVDAADGNYGAAFSNAVSAAIAAALSDLK